MPYRPRAASFKKGLLTLLNSFIMKSLLQKKYTLLVTVSMFVISCISARNAGVPEGGPETNTAAVVTAPPASLAADADFNFFISANPSNREVTLNFVNSSIGIMRISVFSYIGREVFTKLVPISDDGAATTTLSLPGALPAGTYMMKAESSKSACTKMFMLRAGA
jgi:hypothetical protein